MPATIATQIPTSAAVSPPQSAPQQHSQIANDLLGESAKQTFDDQGGRDRQQQQWNGDGAHRQGSQNAFVPDLSDPQCMPPKNDPEVPFDCMKILSRTLYVGGVSTAVTKEKMRELFETSGRVDTVMINYPKYNAFIKMFTREEADKARVALNRTVLNGALLKVGWGCGFGPKNTFDYATGFNIVPISRMSESNKKWISTSNRGGGPIQGSTVIEEPNVGYDPIGNPARDTAVGAEEMEETGQSGP
ncbi:hypothetical protein HDU67_007631, partial [Dinochytrium kinnereticum]